MFRARVFPIPAGKSQKLSLTYTRMLDSQGDSRRLHLPLTALRRSPQPFRFELEGSIAGRRPITALYSPTHGIEDISTPPADASDGMPKRTLFRVRQPQCTADLDFLAYFKPDPPDGFADALVLSERPRPDEPGYFLAIVQGVQAGEIQPQPKDVVFVLDRSGSMKGAKIEQARDALRFLVQRLQPTDRFNLITYSNDVTVYGQGLQVATAEEIGRVHGFLGGVEANGGTNIQDALTTALGLFTEGARPRQIVFLTDGLPTVGERNDHKICALVRDKNPLGTRVVAFGVGYDVNGAFLDRLAVQNRGLSEYVLPNENIEDKVPGFYARMQSPLVLDAQVAIEGTKTFDRFPRETGDLYAGHRILIAGRYDQAGKARLVLSGKRGNEPVRAEFEVSLAADARSGERDLVGRIYAAMKIGFLVDEIRLNGENKELVDEIVRLGTRFGILTEYTSFLAADDTDLAAFAANGRKAMDVLKERVGTVTGSHGVAQALNSKKLQRDANVQTQNGWLGADGKMVTVLGVQNVAGKTLFKRGATWRDPESGAKPADEVVDVYSDRFFALLEQNTWLASCIARTGDLTVEIEGKVVRLKSDE
jgi:Ca-activated chloride channel family protein